MMNCLAHTLVIAIAKVANDPDYKGSEDRAPKSGSRASIPELQTFQHHLS
jgi:hypothetical protein